MTRQKKTRMKSEWLKAFHISVVPTTDNGLALACYGVDAWQYQTAAILCLQEVINRDDEDIDILLKQVRAYLKPSVRLQRLVRTLQLVDELRKYMKARAEVLGVEFDLTNEDIALALTDGVIGLSGVQIADGAIVGDTRTPEFFAGYCRRDGKRRLRMENDGAR